MVPLIRTAIELSKVVSKLKSTNSDIGLVPTMGNLHEGHLSLVRKSIENHQQTIVTIYVNPTQFGEGEDLSSYPRTLNEDLEKLRQFNDIIVFCPKNDHEVYAQKPMINFSIPSLEKVLCGRNRPGHFNGVMQVIYRLFKMTEPNVAYFGKKDFQQLLIIKNFAKEMFPEIDIVGVDIVRQSNGLAMSSRNNYLSKTDQQQALNLRETLLEAKAIFFSNKKEVLKFIEDTKKNDSSWDYIELLDSRNLSSPSKETRSLILAGAYKLGAARIIDNITFEA